MGKRKPRRKAPPKMAAPKLELEFDCPFCCSIKSVQVLMKRKEHLASLICRVCNVDFETEVSPLDEPVDVFSTWIDSCEEVNSPVEKQSSGSLGIPLQSRMGVVPPAAPLRHLTTIPPSKTRSSTAAAPSKRRRTDGTRFGSNRRGSSDVDLEQEELAEAQLEDEGSYSVHEDEEEDEEEEEEELAFEEGGDDEAAAEQEPADNIPVRSGRLRKKANDNDSDDDDEGQ